MAPRGFWSQKKQGQASITAAPSFMGFLLSIPGFVNVERAPGCFSASQVEGLQDQGAARVRRTSTSHLTLVVTRLSRDSSS